MEKVIVTGGAGFIGSHIVDALINKGYDVHIIDNLSSGIEENINSKATFHNVDIRDFEKLKPIFTNAKYVFHEAAIPQVQYSIENPIETHDINVTGFLNVLESCRLNNVKRLIFASSCAVYGDQKIIPINEDSNPMPLSPYGTHKYIGESYASLYFRVFGLETVSLRYFNVYGPRQSSVGAYASVIAKFIDLKKQNKPFIIYGDGEQTRSFVNVSDIVNANLQAMLGDSVGNGEAINIGTTDKYSVNQIAQMIGVNGDETQKLPARVEIRNISADITKAKNLLNWEPSISLEVGIDELKRYNNI
jgi:UDP-glucose 4-epimerase